MTPEQRAEWEQIVKECKTTSMWERKLAMLLIAVDAELEALRAQVARLVDSLDGIKAAMWSELHTIDECPQWRYPDFSKAVADFRSIAHNFLCASAGDATSAREWLEAHDEHVETDQHRRAAMPSEAALELWRTIAEMLDTASDSAIVDIIDRAIQQARDAALEEAAIVAETPATRDMAIKIRTLKSTKPEGR